ncbi:MAG: hypothetical protein HGA27_05945 [Peptococcaceae bacterium]|nr:hypothetical protein [Peptococcaceae bacterium]
MELALYHPVHGYYMSDRVKTGKKGDFYTSPHVSRLFGMILADQINQMWIVSGKPNQWMILEGGAGNGRLAGDIIDHCGAVHPHMFKVLEYVILDKSPFMISLQKEILSDLSRRPGKGIRWIKSPEDIGDQSVVGCVISNELFDSFPVHRIKKSAGAIREIFISIDGESLCEALDSVASEGLEKYILDNNPNLAEGQTIEVNLAMKQHLEGIGRIMKKGFHLTVDYGGLVSDIFSDVGKEGTLRCFYRHKLCNNPYEKPGHYDMTANVNFTDFYRWGEDAGLKPLGYSRQKDFFFNLGILDYLEDMQKIGCSDEALLKNTLAVKKLIMPEGMGNVFKVAVQYKGIKERPILRGFPEKFRIWGKQN